VAKGDAPRKRQRHEQSAPQRTAGRFDRERDAADDAAFEAGRYEAAVAAAHDALELDVNAPLTYYMLGRAYAKLGDTAQAIAA
jgi:predicted Zn-dependent protease